MKEYHVYILRCADDSLYTGVTSNLEIRISEHNLGVKPGYTKSRRPVKLIYNQSFQQIEDAIQAEKQIKGWSRKKKLALSENNIPKLKHLSRTCKCVECQN